MTHGSMYTYGRLGCRCDACRLANREAHRRYRRRKGIPTIEERRAQQRRTHGLYSTYANAGCRCWQCKEASRDYRRALRARQRGETVGYDPIAFDRQLRQERSDHRRVIV